MAEDLPIHKCFKVYLLAALLGSFLFVSLCLSPFLFGYLGFRYGIGDSLDWVMFGRGGETVWSSKFSEQKFDSITVGMTRAEVISILGEPVLDAEALFFAYKKNGSPDQYHHRTVYLQNGLVAGKYRSFYWD